MVDRTPLDPGAFLRDHVAPRSRRRIDELREQIARLEGELADRLAAEATIELVLEGDGGGVWYLNLRQGDTQVAAAPAAPPVIRVYQSRADWNALARSEVAPGAVSEGGTPAGDLTSAHIVRLQNLQGALEIRLQADDGELRTVVQFGAGERAAPRCTLRLRIEDARRLRCGQLAPQVAFLQGLVKLEGDLAFAMQIGTALFL